MLQRIQSLFLIISAVCMGIFLGTNSFVIANGPEDKFVVNPYHVFHQKGGLAVFDKPIYYVAVLAVLALGLSIFTIFQYKNRLRQTLFVALNSLLMGTALGITVYQIQNTVIPMAENSQNGAYGIGMWAAFIGLISNWLANRFIKRDEKLVRDSERMR